MVTATRRPQPFAEAPVSMSVTGRRELSGFNSFSLSGPLRHLPGVTQVGSQVSIRGSSGYSRGTGSRVLLLFDGVPALSADQGDIKWDIIPVTEVERVELIKGAGSAMYGTGALGGVINVLTRSPSELPETRFRLVSGLHDQPAHPSWKWRDLMYLGGVDVSRSGTTAAGGYLVSAGHKRGTGYRENSESTRYNLFAKGTRQLGRHTRWTGLANWALDDHEVFLQWKDRATPLLVPEGDRGAATVSWKLNLNTEVTHLVNPGTNLRWRGFYFRTDFDNTRAAGGLASAGHKIGTELQLDLGERLGSRGVIVGATGIYDLARSPGDFLGERTVLNTALYAQNAVDFRDLELTLGMRADLHRRGAGKAPEAGGPCGSGNRQRPHPGPHGSPVQPPGRAVLENGPRRHPALGRPRLPGPLGHRDPRPGRRLGNPRLSEPRPRLGAQLVVRGGNQAGYRRGTGHRRRPVLERVRRPDRSQARTDLRGRPAGELSQHLPGPHSRAGARAAAGASVRGDMEGLLHLGRRPGVPRRGGAAAAVLPRRPASGETAPLPYRSRHSVNSSLGMARGASRGGLSFRYMSRFERVSGLFAECRRDHLPVYLVDAFVERRIGPATLTLRVDNLLRYHYILSEREMRPMRRVTAAISGTL